MTRGVTQTTCAVWQETAQVCCGLCPGPHVCRGCGLRLGLSWPLACVTRGVTHCLHAVPDEEAPFEEALNALAKWVVDNRLQMIENHLAQQNSIRRGIPPVAPTQEKGGETGPTGSSQWAWEGPYFANGGVNRPVSIPKVLLFYGIPAIAAKARTVQTKLNFHLTLGRVKEELLGGKEEFILFNAEKIAAFMRGRAQLACEEGLFHRQEVADHEQWVANLSVVLQRAEVELSSVTQNTSVQHIRSAWVNIVMHVAEFEEFHYARQWLWWDNRSEFTTRFNYLLCDINRVAHGVGASTVRVGPSGGPSTASDEVCRMVKERLRKAGLLDSRSSETEWKRDRMIDQLVNEESLRRTARRFDGHGGGRPYNMPAPGRGAGRGPAPPPR